MIVELKSPRRRMWVRRLRPYIGFELILLVAAALLYGLSHTDDPADFGRIVQLVGLGMVPLGLFLGSGWQTRGNCQQHEHFVAQSVCDQGLHGHKLVTGYLSSSLGLIALALFFAVLNVGLGALIQWIS